MKYLGIDTNINDLCFTNDLNQLRDSVIISLFTWRRTNTGDLPPTNYQYGWWADSYNTTKIGSRLYLLLREKITDSLIPRVDSIVKEALQWLIDDGIVAEIIINSSRASVNTIQTNIELIRNNETSLNLQYNNIWEGY